MWHAINTQQQQQHIQDFSEAKTMPKGMSSCCPKVERNQEKLEPNWVDEYEMPLERQFLNRRESEGLDNLGLGSLKHR